MFRLRAAWVLIVLLVCGGCVGGSGASVRHKGRPAGVVSMPLKGVYRVTIIPPFDFIGPISGRISAEATDEGFIASTRPGIAWDMIGGVEGVLGSLFVPFVFPGGTIGTWDSSVPANGTPGEGWFGVGGIKNAGVRTRINSPDQPVELLVRDGRRVGLLLLEPDTPDSPPLRDYSGLADDIEKAVRHQLFDPVAAKSISVRAYLKQMVYNSRMARDDVEFIFGTVAAARNHVKFTMPVAFPKGDPASRAAMKDWKVDEFTTVRASYDRRTGLAWLRVDAFLEAEDVDRAFARILSWQPKGLIIDLRSAPGVSLASLRVLNWIAKEPVETGIWFGRAARQDVLARPQSADRFDLTSAAGVQEIEGALDAGKAARITAMPEANSFRGPVAILTSRRTSASAEPLVLAFKQAGRGPVIGQPTAGKPYLSRPLDIRDRWVLWLATCDYRSPDGQPIPAAGVRPDVEVAGRDAAAREAERRLLSQVDPSPTARDSNAGNSDPGASPLEPILKAAEPKP